MSNAITFNHGVEGSSPSALTNKINNLSGFSTHFDLFDFPSCTQCVHKPGAYVRASVLDDTDTLGAVVLLVVLLLFGAAALWRRTK